MNYIIRDIVGKNRNITLEEWINGASKIKEKDSKSRMWQNLRYRICAIQHYLTIMGGKSVCLSVCQSPLAPSLLHGREPRLRRLSPWVLGTCPPPCPHLPSRAAWEGLGWVCGALVTLWQYGGGKNFPGATNFSRHRCHRLTLAIGSVAPSARRAGTLLVSRTE